MAKKKYLEGLEGPKDIKKIPKKNIQRLADEVREHIIESISRCGGHFGSNLGVVELTTALHYVYDTPRDRIVWDVGHQAYAHKVLTGRKSKLATIRQKGGLAPFPKRDESVHDAFGVGHSSTSISAAVGMALAHEGEAQAPQVVAVIGDGAFGGGMVFEALNHAGDKRADILVILNDNEMSISPNVGSLHKYFTRLISSPAYLKVRRKGKKILNRVPSMQEIVRRTEEHAKGMIAPGTLFEELGFGYYGPIDGHDTEAIIGVLRNLKKVHGPRLLHVVTKKGKGLDAAENDALSLHAVGAKFDPHCTKEHPGGKKVTYTDVFSSWICDMAKEDEKLFAITPAMREGSGLVAFEKQFPARYHDVGIAEQHAVTFAAGLACEDKKPVVTIYSTFLQRAYDQLIHDVAIQNLDVTFAIDRAGVVGPDGATHAGSFDLAYLRTVPQMVVMAPADEKECRDMLTTAYMYNGPAAVRYPRGSGSGIDPGNEIVEMKIGKADVRRRGKKVAILAFGAMVGVAQSVADDLDATLVNMRFVKPLDVAMLKRLAKTHEYFITIEDGVVLGGAGSAVAEYVSEHKLDVYVKNLGLPDTFLEHGTREELLDECGLNKKGIKRAIEKFIAQK